MNTEDNSNNHATIMQHKAHRWAALVASAAVLVAIGSPAPARAQSEALMEMLIRKGILTEQEAEDLKADMFKETKSNARLFWKDGLNFESGDKKLKGKLGGRIQLDAAVFSEDDDVTAIPGVGDIPAAVEFRRVRLSLEGEYALSTPVLYKVELDFAGSVVAFKDVYLGLTAIPFVGTIQAGHFKEPIGLEILTSSRYLTFLERAAPMEAFAPERNTGFMVSNTNLYNRLIWAVGGFTDAGDSGNATLDSNYRVSGRLGGLPWYDEEALGRKLLHVGVSGSVIGPSGDMVRFRSRPEAHLAPRFVDTAAFAADRQYLAGVEAALVCGPFSVQAEYLRTWVDTLPGGTAEFDGFYVYGSWFITGENRAYRRSNGTFDRSRPTHNLAFPNPGTRDLEGGAGAWEVAVRYSSLDLNDGAITGGRLNDITAGLNWYLNPNMKVQFNYVYAMVDRTVAGVNFDGSAHIFQTRLHVDF